MGGHADHDDATNDEPFDYEKAFPSDASGDGSGSVAGSSSGSDQLDGLEGLEGLDSFDESEFDELFRSLEQLSEPGWYTIDREHVVQAFWDGTMWCRTRRWRGVGWFEDDTASLISPAVSTAAGVSSVNYGPASIVSPRGGSTTLPPSLVRQRAEAAAAAVRAANPTKPRMNGVAVASLVLSTLGLLGFGSVLGILLGVRARREIRLSRGTERGDRLATAGIIVGIVTLVLFVVAVSFGVVAVTRTLTHRYRSLYDNGIVTAPAQTSGTSTQATPRAQMAAANQCESDLRMVDIAVTAYRAQRGAFPAPPSIWSPSTYAANYAQLTSHLDGGPWLETAPNTDAYVVEYDASGNVWVSPGGTYEATYVPSQGLASTSDACSIAVS